MIDLPDAIISRMSSLELTTRSFPILTEWGMRDEEVLVHSVGCGVWNLLGHELGYMAVAECPAPSSHGADIRLDSTWFCRQNRTPSALIEFERFDGSQRGQQKLDEKIRNLLEASVRWGGTPSVLVLSAWNKGVVTAPDVEAITRRCREGFKSASGATITPNRNTAILFSRFIFEIRQNGCLSLNKASCARLM